MNCPRCGGNAQVLLNLVSCSTPACRFYEPKWANSPKNGPLFAHHSTSHTFLGRYTNMGVKFDLYHYTNNGINFCLARFKDTDKAACYYVDEAATEIGTVAGGATKKASKAVQGALKEAIRRFQAKK